MQQQKLFRRKVDQLRHRAGCMVFLSFYYYYLCMTSLLFIIILIDFFQHDFQFYCLHTSCNLSQLLLKVNLADELFYWSVLPSALGMVLGVSLHMVLKCNTKPELCHKLRNEPILGIQANVLSIQVQLCIEQYISSGPMIISYYIHLFEENEIISKDKIVKLPTIWYLLSVQI